MEQKFSFNEKTVKNIMTKQGYYNINKERIWHPIHGFMKENPQEYQQMMVYFMRQKDLSYIALLAQGYRNGIWDWQSGEGDEYRKNTEGFLLSLLDYELPKLDKGIFINRKVVLSLIYMMGYSTIIRDIMNMLLRKAQESMIYSWEFFQNANFYLPPLNRQSL